MELAVFTLSTVPAGIVAAFKDEAAKHTQQTAINPMNLFRIIFCFEKLICESCGKERVGSKFDALNEASLMGAS